MDNAKLLADVDDIIMQINDILDFTSEIERSSFHENRLAYKAVVKSFDLIFERVCQWNKQFSEVLALYPQVQWTEMIRMRTITVHQFHKLDSQILWDTIDRDLPILMGAMRDLRQRLHTGEPPS